MMTTEEMLKKEAMRLKMEKLRASKTHKGGVHKCKILGRKNFCVC